MILLVGLVFSVSAAGEGEAEMDLVDVTWVSPRGTLEVMDDYNMWVAIEMGYFEDMGISVDMQPGPMEAQTPEKMVAQGLADVSYPSPGVLTAAVDQGVEVIMAFELIGGQVFDFAVAADSDITEVQQIEGKTIAIAFAGWDVIVAPILSELGIDPDSVEYQAVGAQWGQAVDQGRADVALTWKGLRAQWDAIGLDLRYFIGDEFSGLPSNGYAVRKADLEDPERRELLTKVLRGAAMGMHFARHNPRAAAQITYDRFAAVQEQMAPELALESMWQLHDGYVWSKDNLGMYGQLPTDRWEKYLDVIADLGQTTKRLELDEVMTNELIEAANDFDHDQVAEDARDYELNETWSAVNVDMTRW